MLRVQVYEASLAVLLLGYCEDCRVHAGEATMSPKPLIETLQVSLAPSLHADRLLGKFTYLASKFQKPEKITGRVKLQEPALCLGRT